MTETRRGVSGGERIDTTCKYAVSGPVPGAVMAELRRGHALQNRLVEPEQAYQAAKQRPGRKIAAAVWCEHGDESPPGESLAPKRTRSGYQPSWPGGIDPDLALMSHVLAGVPRNANSTAAHALTRATARSAAQS